MGLGVEDGVGSEPVAGGVTEEHSSAQVGTQAPSPNSPRNRSTSSSCTYCNLGGFSLLDMLEKKV